MLKNVRRAPCFCGAVFQSTECPIPRPFERGSILTLSSAPVQSRENVNETASACLRAETVKTGQKGPPKSAVTSMSVRTKRFYRLVGTWKAP